MLSRKNKAERKESSKKSITLNCFFYPIINLIYLMRPLYTVFLLHFFLFFSAQERPTQDILLSHYTYPFEVQFLELNSQNQDLKMAYMDVKPKKPNGKSVLLLHGKNFNGAYWESTIKRLTEEGYRVVVPDQIGFGKSSKPIGYQFSFQALAEHTRALLDTLKIDKTHVLGHSMGGMLATRFTLMFPQRVEKLILENPIGLEDWKLVVPYTSIEENYQKELKVTYESVKAYQKEFYYDQNWKKAYEPWAYLLTAWVNSKNYPIVARVNAQTSDMVFTQPVLYEFPLIKAPTLLIIGTRDRTAIGKNLVKDPKVAASLGQYQLLGKKTQQAIPNSKLVELENVGHLPHIEVFPRFITPLLEFLKN